LISKVIFYITPEFCAYIPHNKFTWTMTIQDIHIILLISMKIFSLLNIKYKVINSPRCRIYILLSINYYTHKKKKKMRYRIKVNLVTLNIWDGDLSQKWDPVSTSGMQWSVQRPKAEALTFSGNTRVALIQTLPPFSHILSYIQICSDLKYQWTNQLTTRNEKDIHRRTTKTSLTFLLLTACCRPHQRIWLLSRRGISFSWYTSAWVHEHRV
jgi:hypothetical protein